MTKAALAKHYQVTTNTITAWLSKGCPHTRRKDGSYRFDCTEVRRWRAENLSTLSAPTKGAKSYTEGRGRKELALAGLRELQLRHQQGELVERRKVEKEAFHIGQIVRDHILNIPDRLAGLLAVETNVTIVHAMLTKELRQALESLSKAPIIEEVITNKRSNGIH